MDDKPYHNDKELKQTVTELKTEVRRLKRTEDRFRKTFDASPMGILIYKLKPANRLELRKVNTAANKILQIDCEEVIGKTIEEAFPPLAETEVPDRFRRVAADGIPWYTEQVSYEDEKIQGAFEVHAFQIEKDTMAAMFQDITDRKKSEERLREYGEALERSNKELEQFAYVASHDLQEPLRMVASYTQLLARRYKGKLDSDADEFIAYAVDGATRMQVLINDLLAFSRVGTKGKEFEPTSCQEILKRSLGNLRIIIEDSGAEVICNSLPTVAVDDMQVEMLFQNLINNAIKFRSKERPRIHISAESNGDKWVFSVRDNGIGIDPEYNDRIFEVFQSLHGIEEYPGTGIGLAICKKIVERHGGRIWVESEPGAGSTFRFTIPVKGENLI